MHSSESQDFHANVELCQQAKCSYIYLQVIPKASFYRRTKTILAIWQLQHNVCNIASPSNTRKCSLANIGCCVYRYLTLKGTYNKQAFKNSVRFSARIPGFPLNTKDNRGLKGINHETTKEPGNWWLFGLWPHLKRSSSSKKSKLSNESNVNIV